MTAEVREGVSWLVSHPVLRYTSPMAGLSNLATTGIVAVFVLYAQDVVGVNDLGYGLLLSALGVGGLAGALFAGRVMRRIGPAWTLRVAASLGPPVAILMVAVPHPAVVALAVLVFGGSTSLWNVANITLRQQLVPDELRGRVAASSRLITWGSQPLGAAIGGAAAALFGLGAPSVLAAAILAFEAAIAFARVTPGAIATAQLRLEAGASA